MVLGDLQQEQAKLKKLEQDLADLQAKVDKQEAHHNELKKGKEDCDRVANEIRGTQDQVQRQWQDFAGSGGGESLSGFGIDRRCRVF